MTTWGRDVKETHDHDDVSFAFVVEEE